jgi:predicted site-specific integrase-resolvase
MVQDLMTIIDGFSYRLQGLRRYKKIIKAAASENTDSL